jgi:hypothetical protein
MSGHGEKLTRKQEQAIAALLCQPTIAAAAKQAKVSEATLRRWLGDPAFKAAYAAARCEVLERTVVLLLGATRKSVECLECNLTAEKPGDQIRAAVAILEQATKGIELLDLESRLAALEEAEAARAQGGGR